MDPLRAGLGLEGDRVDHPAVIPPAATPLRCGPGAPPRSAPTACQSTAHPDRRSDDLNETASAGRVRGSNGRHLPRPTRQQVPGPSGASPLWIRRHGRYGLCAQDITSTARGVIGSPSPRNHAVQADLGRRASVISAVGSCSVAVRGDIMFLQLQDPERGIFSTEATQSMSNDARRIARGRREWGHVAINMFRRVPSHPRPGCPPLRSATAARPPVRHSPTSPRRRHLSCGCVSSSIPGS